MVQRKVSNKLGIRPKNTIKTDKKHATTKPSFQNYDVKIKVDDIKAIRMKKWRSIKLSNTEFSPSKSREMSQQPGEPPTVVTPTKTPSPKKPLSGNKSSHYGSPNYMKGTSSSEARKEKMTTKVSISATLKFHMVGKTLVKTSRMNKVRTLTKAPTFKHTRTRECNKKMVLFENHEAQRATCSSTLKDSKFPSYLKLTPGATEVEGTSVMKVCPYNYCSLNGHRHALVPPLKSFLSSRRRMLKTQTNVKPDVFSPGKQKVSEIKVTEDDSEKGFILSGISATTEDQSDDFFVEVHVSRHDLQDDMNFSSEEKVGEECLLTPLQIEASSECCYNAIDLEMGSDSSVSLDQFFEEMSNMKWEEGQVKDIYDEKVEVLVQKDYGDDEAQPDFELEKYVDEKLMPYVHDGILECLQFSDADISDSESPLTGDDYIEDQVVDNETIWTPELGEESIKEQDTGFSNPIVEFTEASNGEFDFKEPNETNGDELHEDINMDEETKDGVVMGERISSENETKNEENMGEEQILMADNDSQAEVDQTEARNKEDASLSISAECQVHERNLSPVENASVTEVDQNETEAKQVIGVSSTNSDQEHDSSEVKLHSFENCVEEVKALETEEVNQTEEAAALPAIRNKSQRLYKGIFDIGNDSIDELLHSCNKLKRSVRCKKSDEDGEEGRDFNPRPPNFLPVAPEKEPEKVDLRHQDMNEGRNAEDWMLDHALQKTVNQLATARKRKVALLVEAFESVLPIPKYEPHTPRNSSGFAQARPIQACS